MAVAIPTAPQLSKLPRSFVREVLLRLNSLKKGECLFLIILSPCTSILPSQCGLMRGSNLSQATWNSRRMAREVRGRIAIPLDSYCLELICTGVSGHASDLCYLALIVRSINVSRSLLQPEITSWLITRYGSWKIDGECPDWRVCYVFILSLGSYLCLD